MPDKNSKKGILTIPNMISMIRIFAIPFFIWLLKNGDHLGALILFTAAALTDLLDGITARILNQKSRLGALLDPAGDKLLMTAALIALAVPSYNPINTIPIWLASTIIGRDILIVGSAFIFYKTKTMTSFPPTFLGKISTFTQMSVLVLVMLFNALKQTQAQTLLFWFYVLAMTLTISSGFQYLFIGLRIVKKK